MGSKVRWIAVSIQSQQYQRMLDSYPRSDGSQCPSNHNNSKGCWIPIQGPMDTAIHRTLDRNPRSDGSQCPSNQNNIKGCRIPIQGPMDRSVHPIRTISKDVGFLSKVRWIAVSIQS